jgi:hypothetical protein
VSIFGLCSIASLGFVVLLVVVLLVACYTVDNDTHSNYL